MTETSKPLTADDLADALDCFWNAAIGHSHQIASNPIASIAVGFAAVATRLREIDEAHRKPPAARALPLKAVPPAAPAMTPASNSGDACRHCGNFSLIRTGTCQTCTTCGETSGCS